MPVLRENQSLLEQRHREVLRDWGRYPTPKITPIEEDSLEQPSPYKVVDTTTTGNAFQNGDES